MRSLCEREGDDLLSCLCFLEAVFGRVLIRVSGDGSEVISISFRF